MFTPRWKLATYLVLILIGAGATLPNLLPADLLARLPEGMARSHITLGLDLRGGSHLVLEVDSARYLQKRLQGLSDDLKKEAGRPGVGFHAAPDAILVGPIDAAGEKTLRAAARKLVPSSTGAGESVRFERVPDGRLKLSLSEAAVRERLDAAAEQSLEIIRRRVDEIGVAEPTIQRIGADRILVQLPGLEDPTRLRELLGSTAEMNFHMLGPNPEIGGRLAPGVRMLPDQAGATRYPVRERIAISGERLVDAHAGFDQQTREPIVSLRFDGTGARQFATITRQNVGQPFAIVLDGKVLSAPVIREPITGGSGQISGGFSLADTTVLAALLRAGALPAPLTVIEERSVGPDLGGDAIEMGLWTGLAGFALVALFMLALYGGWGLIANIALGLNVVLTLGGLSLLGATLTLPGIAGIILGIGLAVDANILINERIREETRKGASAYKALDTGFRRAYSTIVDANITTLIATTLLFMFGSGPVRGFAVTMMLGIVISMFTAVAVVRVIMTEIVGRRRLRTLEIRSPFRVATGGRAIFFMKARYLGIGVSIFLSLASVGLFLKPGLNYGIDFKGGIQLEVETTRPADLRDMRERLARLGLGEITLQQIGSDRNLLVRAERQEGGEAAQAAALQAMRTAIATIDGGAAVKRTEVVGPKISGELARSGVYAVLLAALAMLGYIWWRFEWHFAVGAIATLALDTTKLVGFFAITGLDFNLTAIAALLTIIGYSVNDKVVVYDRMRENLRIYKRMPLRDLIDLSINQVFARCIYTSLTTFLAVLPMAIWGGKAVESFAVPLVVGVVIATTSSIFIAAPILLFLGDWRRRRADRANADVDSDVPETSGTDPELSKPGGFGNLPKTY